MYHPKLAFQKLNFWFFYDCFLVIDPNYDAKTKAWRTKYYYEAICRMVACISYVIKSCAVAKQLGIKGANF